MKIPRKTILAGNRILAEMEGRSFSMSHISDYKNVPDEKLPKMKYHNSWEWLIPVAQVCLRSYGDKRENIFSALAACDREALWVACINFCLWAKQYPKLVEHYRKHGQTPNTEPRRGTYKVIDFLNGQLTEREVKN